MRSGGKTARRLMAALALSVVAFAAAGPASAVRVPLDTWSGRATGSVVELSVRLPAILQSAFDTLNLESPLPATIQDKVVHSLADAQWRWGDAGSTAGHGLGELLDATNGTLGKTINGIVPLPRADVSLDQPAEMASLLTVDQIPGVSIAAGEVAAKARKLAAKVIDSKGASSIVDLRITLGDLIAALPAGQDEINSAIDTLLGVLYGSEANPEPLRDGLVPALQTQLDAAKEALKSAGVDIEGATGLDLTLPTITRADLLDKPLLAIGLIQSTSTVTDGTGSLAGYKVAKARSIVKDISVLGGLVRIEALIAEAGVAANGRPGQAKLLPAVQKLVGVTVGSNRIEIGDFTRLTGITINGKNVDLTKLGVPADVVATISSLYETLLTQVVGLALSVPPVEQGVQETRLMQKAHQYVTALNLRVAPLSEPVMGVDLSAAAALLPTIDVKFSTANAEIGSTPLTALPVCIGVCNPVTGVPMSAYWVLGPALLGAAVLVRRFALAKN